MNDLVDYVHFGIAEGKNVTLKKKNMEIIFKVNLHNKNLRLIPLMVHSIVWAYFKTIVFFIRYFIIH